MRLEDFPERYTTIFLTDAKEPARLLLLERAADRKFAPNLYTGLGGKVEEGEDQLTCARRELGEETGLTDVPLFEFGRLIINRKKVLCQFTGTLEPGAVPDCPEGRLWWLEMGNVFTKPLIPTAALFLREWQARGWDVGRPFTLFVERERLEDINSPLTGRAVFEGLVWS